MKKFLAYFIPIVLCLAVGMIGSRIQTSALAEWYPTLVKSPLTPPAIVFPIAWTVLYILMGVSIGILIAKGDMSVVRLWIFQLLVNFLWSVGFFALRSPLAGLITILILDVLVFAYIIYAYSRSRWAAWLFVPYMLWLLFASYLTGYIYLNNDTQSGGLKAATISKTAYNMTTETLTYTMPKLSFSAENLAPIMSRETIEYHYGKHLKGYLDNLNRLIVATPLEGKPLEQVVMLSDGPLFNNAAQVLNHTLFFETLKGGGSQIPTELKHKIERDFGSVEQFKSEFTTAATSLFGSGWVWLVEDKDGRLSIVATSNADCPIRKGLNPLLVLDVWEHAYYIDYRNRRGDFIKGWWGIIDWDKVAQRTKKRG